MKFRVERDVFADAVAWAARSLPVRPSSPVLAGLLIEASDAGLVLSTFDYETSARATLSTEVNDEGRALVSGALGLALVLLVSGLIEGFVTGSGLPTWVRVGIGVLAEVAFLAYVFVRGKRAYQAGETGDVLAADRPDEVPVAP